MAGLERKRGHEFVMSIPCVTKEHMQLRNQHAQVLSISALHAVSRTVSFSTQTVKSLPVTHSC